MSGGWVVGDAGAVTAFPTPYRTEGRDALLYALGIGFAVVGAGAASVLGRALDGPAGWAASLVVGVAGALAIVAAGRMTTRPGAWLAVRADAVECGDLRIPRSGWDSVSALSPLALRRDPSRVRRRVPFEDVARWEDVPDGLVAVLDSGDRVRIDVPADRQADVRSELVPVWSRFRAGLVNDRRADAGARAAISRLTDER